MQWPKKRANCRGRYATWWLITCGAVLLAELFPLSDRSTVWTDQLPVDSIRRPSVTWRRPDALGGSMWRRCRAEVQRMGIEVRPGLLAPDGPDPNSSDCHNCLRRFSRGLQRLRLLENTRLISGVRGQNGQSETSARQGEWALVIIQFQSKKKEKRTVLYLPPWEVPC